MSGGGGFGIAGHKNNYSQGVRCGNWVEDKIGMDLVSTGVSHPDHFMTETRAHFSQPKRKEDAAPRNLSGLDSTGKDPTAHELPHHLLFAHGYEAHDPRAGLDTAYASMSQTLFGAKPKKTTEILATHPDADTTRVLSETRNTAARELSKSLAREAKDGALTETMRVQARAGPVRPKKGEEVVHRPRRNDFTKEFKAGIRGLRR